MAVSSEAERSGTGRLYLVGTPIGNLEDMTPRAIATLRAVDLIAAEDTRYTGKLLAHFGIATPQVSYHAHNHRQRLPSLIARLQAGARVALVTDAGMPGISDPGSELAAACIEAGIPVTPIPGATAAIAALVASGFDTQRFAFEGFLPSSGKDRRARLESLIPETRTVILYEAPHRLTRTLTDLQAVLGGDRPIALARELTKLHETIWRGTLAEAVARYAADDTPRGEFTIVVGGASPRQAPEWTEAALREALQDQLNRGLSRSQASKAVAHLTGLPRQRLYQLALALPTPDARE